MSLLLPERLQGRWVTLEPLSRMHLGDLEAAYAQELSQYYPKHFLSASDYFSQVVENSCFGPATVYAVINSEKRAVGCTGFFNADSKNKKIEIGGTWYATSVQGTAINAEAKLLLLDHAFRTLGCIRVEFKTDSLNQRSQAALEKLGATREGVLRNHFIMPTGRLRHSVFYSIIADEWPRVREHLESRVAHKVKAKT